MPGVFIQTKYILPIITAIYKYISSFYTIIYFHKKVLFYYAMTETIDFPFRLISNFFAVVFNVCCLKPKDINFFLFIRNLIKLGINII